MKLYAFDAIDETLELVPIAARRALDRAGVRLSLAGWQSLDPDARRAIVEAGAEREVDVELVERRSRAASPPPDSIPKREELSSSAAPAHVVSAFGKARPIPDAVWASLSWLDRYALAKVAEKAREERMAGAYDEIVGASSVSTHLAPQGGVRMVSVAEKSPSHRRAAAESRVVMNEDAFVRLENQSAPKGDVLGTARLAGIMAAKRTSDLIPLCHPIALTHVGVELQLDRAEKCVRVVAKVEAFDRTGVEMEAMVAASAAALTIYDMLKSVDRGMAVGPTRLLAKSGGRSGDFKA